MGSSYGFQLWVPAMGSSYGFQLWVPQFLRILLRAYERYRAEGLTTPDAPVLSSTSEYQKKIDCFREFCDESLIVSRSHSLSLKDVYTSFKLWYQDSQNKNPPNRGDFAELMTIQFGTMSGRCWKGVGVTDACGDEIIVV
jgi:phage/plasmid-associated DNA primase